VSTQQATFAIHVNPLVDWIWFGVGVMIIGTAIAFLPERAFAFAMAAVPESAVTTSLLVLLLVMSGIGGRTGVHAQDQGPGMQMPGSEVDSVTALPTKPLEKQLDDELICMCGGCGRKRIGECLTCSTAAAERREVAALVAEGKTHDEIIQYFLTKYGGQEVLAEPIDKGFNRLAWLFPYAMGLVGVGAVGSMAVRWTRRRRDDTSANTIASSDELQNQLDDELRELD
jgi:cytochrome c-type biogenesis protein CcmH/NrfF